MKRWTISLLALAVAFVLSTYFISTHLQGQAPTTKAEAMAVPRELTSYRDIVKKVLPAVVSIDSKINLANGFKKNAPMLPPNLPEEFRRFFEDFQMPEGGFEPRVGFGSGFFIDASGVVLTNNHVVDGADQVVVHLEDGRKFVSKDIHGDRRTDLAIIKLDLKGAKAPFLVFGDSNAMDIGDHVLAVGAPFGLTGSVTHGIISAKGRAGLHMNMYEDFLQTDAAINPGNSGGPLVNLSGQVVGINAAIKSQSGGFQGVGLAVASNLAKQVSKSLLTDGVVRRGFLGVQIRELDADVAVRLGIAKDTGVVISEVYDNTPASKAGLQAGDIITGIAGKNVKDGRTLQTIVAVLPIGKASEFAIVRDGKSLNVSVTVEEQPSKFGTQPVPVPRNPRPGQESLSLNRIGVDVADLTESLADDFGYRKGTKGVVVTGVHPSSLSSDANIRPGMLITKIDNQQVTTADDLRQKVQAASLVRGVLLQVQSPQGGVSFSLLRSNMD